ncbi:hypothetical protein NMG60_11023037 [Bertholletia excelsa]
MALVRLSILLLLSTSCLVARVHHSGNRHPQTKNFVKLQCMATCYPKLCFRYLSKYANGTKAQGPGNLAQVALSVSLVRAHCTRPYMTKVAAEMKRKKAKDYQVVKEYNFIWHTSNVQTWVSTALPEASTCVNGISGPAMGGKVKTMIKAKVLNVEQYTIIVLALFNRFVARHQAAFGKP